MNCRIRKGRALLVEDCIINALPVVNMMKNAGYEAVHALTGEEAVGMIEAGSRFNFILMDVDLGDGISGTTAAARILDICRLPVIFLTNCSGEEIADLMEGYSYGYISKQSFSPRAIRALLKRLPPYPLPGLLNRGVFSKNRD